MEDWQPSPRVSWGDVDDASEPDTPPSTPPRTLREPRYSRGSSSREIDSIGVEDAKLSARPVRGIHSRTSLYAKHEKRYQMAAAVPEEVPAQATYRVGLRGGKLFYVSAPMQERGERPLG